MSKHRPVIDPVAADAMADRLRKKLRNKLGRMPDKVIIEFGSKVKKAGPITDTDWPDSFPRDRWYKTWAKGSADAVIKPGVERKGATKAATSKPITSKTPG